VNTEGRGVSGGGGSEASAASTARKPEALVAGGLDAEALRIYRDLKAMLERDELPPGVRANVEQALSAMWQVVNNLALDYELPYDLGV